MDLTTLQTKLKTQATPRNLKIAAAIAVVIVILVGGAIYHWKKTHVPVQVAQQQEVTDLVARVSKLMLLPAGETPTIATVSDVDKLRSQAFFKNAVNGDKVLIYASTRQAILYRPSANRIIEVAPLVVGDQTATPPSAAPTPTVPGKPQKK